MKKLSLLFGIALLASCTSKQTEVRFTHQIIVTYNDDKKDTTTFHSSIIKGDSYTETGCTMWLANKCLHVMGCEECDVTGISRCDVRKYDHSITNREEKIIEK
jgi:hypothetical protein